MFQVTITFLQLTVALVAEGGHVVGGGVGYEMRHVEGHAPLCCAGEYAPGVEAVLRANHD